MTSSEFPCPPCCSTPRASAQSPSPHLPRRRLIQQRRRLLERGVRGILGPVTRPGWAPASSRRSPAPPRRRPPTAPRQALRDGRHRRVAHSQSVQNRAASRASSSLPRSAYTELRYQSLAPYPSAPTCTRRTSAPTSRRPCPDGVSPEPRSCRELPTRRWQYTAALPTSRTPQGRGAPKPTIRSGGLLNAEESASAEILAASALAASSTMALWTYSRPFRARRSRATPFAATTSSASGSPRPPTLARAARPSGAWRPGDAQRWSPARRSGGTSRRPARRGPRRGRGARAGRDPGDAAHVLRVQAPDARSASARSPPRSPTRRRGGGDADPARWARRGDRAAGDRARRSRRARARARGAARRAPSARARRRGTSRGSTAAPVRERARVGRADTKRRRRTREAPIQLAERDAGECQGANPP